MKKRERKLSNEKGIKRGKLTYKKLKDEDKRRQHFHDIVKR